MSNISRDYEKKQVLEILKKTSYSTSPSLIENLNRFKEETKEVQHGYECGVLIEDFTDINQNGKWDNKEPYIDYPNNSEY